MDTNLPELADIGGNPNPREKSTLRSQIPNPRRTLKGQIPTPEPRAVSFGYWNLELQICVELRNPDFPGKLVFPIETAASIGSRLLFIFEKRQELSVAFFFQLLDWNKPQRGGIDAVTHATFVRRTVIKDVPKMGIALVASDFGPFHAESAICFFSDVAIFDRFCETGPTAAAVEFVERSKEGFAADNIDVNARAMIVPIFVSERRLGAALLGHVILFGGQFLLQVVSRRFVGRLISG